MREFKIKVVSPGALYPSYSSDDGSVNWRADPEGGGSREIMRKLEIYGRTCYKSEMCMSSLSAPSSGRNSGFGDSYDNFIKNIIKSGHESVIEHVVLTVKIICSRAASHQIVRHRLAAYSQESQRYCDYSKNNNNIYTIIVPPHINNGCDVPRGIYTFSDHFKQGGSWSIEAPHGYKRYMEDFKEIQNPSVLGEWLADSNKAYETYLKWRDKRVPSEDARFKLPNECKTELVMTCNLRQWRHIFKERALNKHAQWEVRKIFKNILLDFNDVLPVIFEDLAKEIIVCDN